MPPPIDVTRKSAVVQPLRKAVSTVPKTKKPAASDGFETKPPVKVELGGASADSGSLSAGTSFSQKVIDARGVGVSFGAKATSTVKKKSEGGYTTYGVEAEVSVSLSGSAKGKGVGVELGHTEGIKSSYDVRLPSSSTVKPGSVNPFDPSTMPKGSVVTLNASANKENEFSASFKQLSVDLKTTTEQGTSVMVEKTGAQKVRVTAGPTSALSSFVGVGVDVGAAKLTAGTEFKLDQAKLKTAEFDLSTDQGRAGYNAFLTTGRMPATNRTGVGGVATIEKTNTSLENSLGVEVGPLKGTVNLGGETGKRVVVTTPDGTKRISADLKYPGNVPLHVDYVVKNGKEALADRRYTFTVKATKGNTDQLNELATQREDGTGSIKQGDTVKVVFTNEQLQKFLEQTRKVANEKEWVRDDLDQLILTRGGQPVTTTDQFADSLARVLNGNDDGFITDRLFRVAKRSGELAGDDNRVEFPGKLVTA